MKLGEIINCLEKSFPVSYAESWDNVGLMIGDRNKNIKKIQISLDVTMKAIDNAVENNIDLIISHHPFIFSPIKNINGDFLLGRKIMKLIENKIAVYSLHTNLDSAQGGLNDFLGEKLQFGEGKIIDPVKEDFQLENQNEPRGIGRLYTLEKPTKAEELIEIIKKRLELKAVTFTGDSEKENLIIKKVAVVNGAGSSYWRKAKRMGATLLITGDVKYHEALDAREEGMYILDVGHYESEHFFHNVIMRILKEQKNIECFIFNDEAVFKKI